MNDPVSPLATLPEPDLRTVLNAHRDEVMALLRCALPGVIESFDDSKQSATVSVCVKAIVFNQAQTSNNQLQFTPSVVDYPALVDVPVYTMGGGDGVITFPVAKGDGCLVIFGDRSIDDWFTTGAVTPPSSARMHDLSDGFALVGFRPWTAPVTDYDMDGVALRYGATKFKAKAGGAQVVADADFSATSTNGGVIAAKAKLDLHNGSTDAKTVLQAAVTALTSLNSVKSGGDASAAITAFSTAINQLFQ